MSVTDRIASRLNKDPIISESQNESLARMVRNIREVRYEAGEQIYSKGEAAEYLYLILEGTIKLDAGSGKAITSTDRFGEEAATDVPFYLSDAVAETEIFVHLIPRSPSLRGLIDHNSDLSAKFYFALLAKDFGKAEIEETLAPTGEKAANKGTWFELVGWSLTILTPMLVLYFGEDLGLDKESKTFLAIFGAAVSMWVFELVKEFLPALFAILLILILGLAPTDVVLSGFSSSGFFMAMSILGLGTVIVLSGLSFRFLLWLLRYLSCIWMGLPSNICGQIIRY